MYTVKGESKGVGLEYLVPGSNIVFVPALLVYGSVPPDGCPRLAVPGGTGDTTRLHVWSDALLLTPLPQGHPAGIALIWHISRSSHLLPHRPGQASGSASLNSPVW